MKNKVLGVAVALVVAAPALAQQAAPTYEPGLVGSVQASDGSALWEYPLDTAWPYRQYQGTAPSPGLLTAFPTTFAGMLDLPAVGEWGVRVRVEGFKAFTVLAVKSCQARIALEGTEVVNAPLRSDAPAATASVAIPETGMYAVSGSVSCADGDPEALKVAFEVKAPGREAWERAPVRRPVKAAPAASSSSAVVIRRGGQEAPVKWVQVVRQHQRRAPDLRGAMGDVVAEVPQPRADLLTLRGYAGEVAKPADSSMSAEATLTTIQRVGEAGRWVYYVAMEQTPNAGDAVKACFGSVSVEGQAVVPLGWFNRYLENRSTFDLVREEIGLRPFNKGPESLALVGVADLVKGEYKLAVTVDCLPRLPQQLRVWVKGPADPALRPLRADEVAVQVATAPTAPVQPSGSAVTLTAPTTAPAAGAGTAPTTSAADIAGKLKAADATIDLTVTFASGSDVIEDQGRAQIAEIAAALRQLDTITVQVEGHTDTVGDDAYNLDLSKRRAAAVVKELTVIHRIDAARLSSTGYGKARPVADNATDDGRAKNRRVTIRRLGTT